MRNRITLQSLVKRLPIILSAAALLLAVGLFAQVNSLGNQLEQAKEDNVFQERLLYNEIDYQKSLQRPAVSVSENLVVFP